VNKAMRIVSGPGLVTCLTMMRRRLRRCYHSSFLDHIDILHADTYLAPTYSSFDWLPECGRR
jgi:hypothetical protein